jgi:D-glycero-alpha-D-manno-heptose-7-phosphate kinase
MTTTVSTAPLRISVAGGGIDMPEYYAHGTTRVIALTVDLFVQVAVGDDPEAVSAALPADSAYRLSPAQAADHPYNLAARRLLGIRDAPFVSVCSQVLPGSGLGGSGSFCVALLDGLSRHRGEQATTARLARLAFALERHELGRTMGQQDGWASAVGGAVRMTFEPGGAARAHSDPELFAVLGPLLETGLVLLRTGRERDAGRVLAGTREVTAAGFAGAVAGARMLEHAYAEGDLRRIGRALSEQWAAKVRRNPAADHPVCRRLSAADATGAVLGFKLVGAGGGGHLLAAVDPDRRAEALALFDDLGLSRVPVRAWPRGLDRATVPSPRPMVATPSRPPGGTSRVP